MPGQWQGRFRNIRVIGDKSRSAQSVEWLHSRPRLLEGLAAATAARVRLVHVVRNPWVWGAIGLCVGLLITAVYLPPISTLLRTTAPGLYGWAMVIGFSLVPTVFGQLWLQLPAPREKRETKR